MGPAATRRPLSRMQNSLATRRAKGSFCSTRSTVRPLFLVQPQDDVADFVNDVGLNAFCRLVENQQLRFQHQRAADRELLLLTAERSPPRRFSIFFSTGNKSKMRCGNFSGAVFSHTQAHAQIFLYRQMRKNFTPLRHVADSDLARSSAGH